ncbi:MAG: hypothetical protein ACRD3E_13805 [Terriglobales bacterium]
MSRSPIAVVLLLSVTALASDLKVSRKTKDGSGEHPQDTYYFQGQRVRFDHRDAFGYDWKDGRAETIAYGPRVATIFQCDMHRVLNLDFDHHQYTVTQLDRDGAPVNAQRVTLPTGTNGAKVRVIVEMRDTGETRQMFGHIAHRFITTRKLVPTAGACATAQETTEDGWYIDIDPRATSCSEMDHPSPKNAVAVLTAGNCRDDYEVEHSGPTPPPFAVDVKITNHADLNGKTATHEMENTVTELSSLPLDPQLFDLPAGYKHVEKLDNSPNLPWLLHARLMWQSAKSMVWGWTPWGR